MERAAKRKTATRMQAQLEEEERRREDMQDSARKQGFGSSVYVGASFRLPSNLLSVQN
jgi:hypothetical protein